MIRRAVRIRCPGTTPLPRRPAVVGHPRIRRGNPESPPPGRGPRWSNVLESARDLLESLAPLHRQVSKEHFRAMVDLHTVGEAGSRTHRWRSITQPRPCDEPLDINEPNQRVLVRLSGKAGPVYPLSPHSRKTPLRHIRTSGVYKIFENSTPPHFPSPLAHTSVSCFPHHSHRTVPVARTWTQDPRTRASNIVVQVAW